MKLLRVKVNGVERFQEDFEIDFLTSQRVSSDDKISLNIYSEKVLENPVSVFAGINASGKTSSLKLISFCYAILSQQPIILDYFDFFSLDDKPIFELYYIINNKLIKHIVKFSISRELLNHQIVIDDESLFIKKLSSVKTLKDRYIFSNDAIKKRNDFDSLPSTVSILYKCLGDEEKTASCFDLIRLNENSVPRGLYEIGKKSDLLNYIVKFLDPTIEYLNTTTNKDVYTFELKYRSGSKLIYNNEVELLGHMSSGTSKGIWVFLVAYMCLNSGSTLIIDEVETHFNKQVVISLINMFNNKRLNIHNASLIVSTHYPEIMDTLERNDSIYIVENNGKVNVSNLSNKINRNDCKKSEIYNSNTLFNTAPSFNAYYDLVAAIKEKI